MKRHQSVIKVSSSPQTMMKKISGYIRGIIPGDLGRFGVVRWIDASNMATHEPLREVATEQGSSCQFAASTLPSSFRLSNVFLIVSHCRWPSSFGSLLSFFSAACLTGLKFVPPLASLASLVPKDTQIKQ